ncbi:MAG TPA: hypothetical protein VLX92_01105 [Kofleriaceae bacterium]|nr:hypothetical protein [Kofleriaceae bacterium]
MGCSSHAAPSGAPQVGRALTAALAAADHERAPWRCAALDGPPLAAEDLAAGAHHWRAADHALRRDDPAPAIAIGVIADAGGSAPPTIAALGRLRAKLDAASPDVVLALGGMGATRAELEATLGALADHASFPLIALPGDLEPVGGQAAAIAALRERGDLVVDGRLARFIELPGVTIGTVPGEPGAARLAAGDDGCAWSPEDAARVYAELSARPGLRIAATADPPRGAADRPAGELGLVAAQPIDVALYGPRGAAASPATSGGRDGAAIALTPGTRDATARLPERRAPSAGVLVIRGATWSWHPIVDAP